VHGYLNGACAQGTLGYIGLLGIAWTVFVLVALLACTVSLRAAWARVAVRVAQWLAAIGLLMLGWALVVNVLVVLTRSGRKQSR
jgi:hypothetical protein